jgi:hypothetical protein
MVPNVNADGYCQETKEVFEYLGFFCMGVFACSIDINPLVTLRKSRRTDRRKQWLVCKKIKDAGYNVVSIWGCEFRKLLSDTPGLKMNFAHTPM